MSNGRGTAAVSLRGGSARRGRCSVILYQPESRELNAPPACGPRCEGGGTALAPPQRGSTIALIRKFDRHMGDPDRDGRECDPQRSGPRAAMAESESWKKGPAVQIPVGDLLLADRRGSRPARRGSGQGCDRVSVAHGATPGVSADTGIGAVAPVMRYWAPQRRSPVLGFRSGIGTLRRPEHVCLARRQPRGILCALRRPRIYRPAQWQRLSAA
jgi:hypothetical protein